MPTYVIGDVQGCYADLQTLLEALSFSAQTDTLWFCGDLVNRGPRSLDCLRFVKGLGSGAVTVLGNHDLTLLMMAHGFLAPNDFLAPILQAKDHIDLIDWLTHQPLLHHAPVHQTTLVHAGIYPRWSLTDAKAYAKEAEHALQSSTLACLEPLFGNTPTRWSTDLSPQDRRRFIFNSFTRMRALSLDGEMDFSFKGPKQKLPHSLVPWYQLPPLAAQETKIVFGHWAALNGLCDSNLGDRIQALDTGCVWGNQLTALCLETNKRFSIACIPTKV